MDWKILRKCLSVRDRASLRLNLKYANERKVEYATIKALGFYPAIFPGNAGLG